MSQLAELKSEANLSEWTSEVDTEGDLNWAAAAGLAGSSGGIELTIDNNTAMYVVKTVTSVTTGIARFRFYIDFNSLTMATNDQWTLIRLRSGSTNMILVDTFKSSTNYQLFIRPYKDDTTVSDSSKVNVSDAPHYIEIVLRRSSGSTANDGNAHIYLDGSLAASVTGVDNYDRFNAWDRIEAGVIVGLDAGTSGVMYLDEFVLRDDDTTIGPVAAGGDPEGSLIGGKLLRGGLLTHGVLVRG